jgi:rod shape-determining protein MreC
MRNLLNFLARFNSFIIFLFLEGIAIYLLATGNNYQNAVIGNNFRNMSRGFDERLSNIRYYLNLQQVNKKLADENATLRNRLEILTRINNSPFLPVYDTIYRQKYTYTTAELISNSVNKQKNYFLLDKGYRQGITTDMAIIADNGAAGVIVGCSDNYSIAMSLLNLDFKLSARIKSNGNFGSIAWDGRDYRYAVLNDIPQHVQVSIGDTIEATGYSAVFPEGTLIGTVSDFAKSGGDFYRIKVSLTTDFRKIHFVEIVGNLKKSEERQLEKQYKVND